MIKITFNKSGYEPFFDFIKAYSILCVLMGHTIPFLNETGYSLWYGMQVPLFVLVQVFHVFKKDCFTFNTKLISKRIIIPFLIIQIIPICLTIFNSKIDNNLIINYISRGGYGPGAYYPWIYLQLAALLAIVRPYFEKVSKALCLIIIVVICQGFEILCSIIELSDWLYRLLAIRYIFLIYLGWLWVKEGIVLNVTTIVLSILSMGTIVYFDYFYSQSEPWLYDTVWRTHRWPCYIYVSILLCGILYWIYGKIKVFKIIENTIKTLAKCSYEIFLMQMIVIPMMPQMNFINNKFVGFGIRTSLIFIISIVGGYYFNRLYKKVCS